MKVVYYNKNYDYNLEIDYRKLMSNGWYNRLSNFLHGQEMADIMYVLLELYNTSTIFNGIFPKRKKDIFNILNKIDLQEINVCIIDCDPKITERSNGVAFANKINHNNDYDEHLVNLLNKVNNYNQETEHLVDYSLDDWISQGVFLYNVALTQMSCSNKSMRSRWSQFSKALLKTINDSTTGMIFLFIGDFESRKPFVDCINTKKHIVLQNHVLDYDSLNDINLEIDGLNGKNYRIKW